MRQAPNMRVEKFRIREGELGSDSSHGNNGMFIIVRKFNDISRRLGPDVRIPVTLVVVCSDGEGWDHISVHVDVNPPRLPTWDEMCYIKNLFFKDDETVVQFHPKKSEYVNCYEYTLHLWKPHNIEIQLPPSWMVGPKEDEIKDRIL